MKQKISVLRAYEVATIGRDDPEARFNDGMNFPIGVAVNSQKDVIVCVSGQHCVKVFGWSGAHKYSKLPTHLINKLSL